MVLLPKTLCTSAQFILIMVNCVGILQENKTQADVTTKTVVLYTIFLKKNVWVRVSVCMHAPVCVIVRACVFETAGLD